MRRHAPIFAVTVGLLALSAPASAQDRDNCLYCHQFPGLSRLDPRTQLVRLFYVDPSYIHSQRGPHARLACTDCHVREEVAVVPHNPVTRVNCANQCHVSSATEPERRFSHREVESHLAAGVHSPETLAKLEFTGGPLLEPGQSQCLYCHDEPVFRQPMSSAGPVREIAQASTDRCDVCHAAQVPLDTQFALRHVGSRLEPARPSLEMAQICAVCHSDPKVIEQFQLHDTVASYVRSFHGKAALLRDQTTANCVSCHVRSGKSAHDMLGPKNPKSAVNPEHVADGCRTTACHPGADKALARTAVHLDLPTSRGTIEFWLAIAFIILTIVSFGPSALIVLLELGQLVVNRHSHVAQHVRRVADMIIQKEGWRKLHRFSVKQRIQHWALTALFILLVVTGFPLKFTDKPWAAEVIGWFGGLHNARWVHHWSGILLVGGFAAHLLDILRGVLVQARAHRKNGESFGIAKVLAALPIAITPTDLIKVNQQIKYLLGLSNERPMFGRFSATEKFEYFGVLWGTTLLGVTGLMLWAEQWATQYFSGRALNLATIAHTYEAYLAVIHVGILHIYNVLLAPAVFPLSKATLSGETPLDKLCEENGEFVLQTARDLGIAVETPQHG
ncbi:MAG: hypothetical protein U1D55_19270 [Phycisphaerae bacterium]